MIEHRRFERAQLTSPVSATAGVVSVKIVDASSTGFKVHHSAPLPPKGEPFTLRMQWNGSSLRMHCSVMWTTALHVPRASTGRPALASGLRIESIDATAKDRLAELIASAGEVPQDDPYIWCELSAGTWRQKRTSRRDQPGDGFTVAASEDPSQIERLCGAYASGDADTRKLIRTLAALSIKSQAEEAVAV